MSKLGGRSGSGGLEDRLRAALGEHGRSGTGGTARAQVSSGAKARVLSGIRLRRLRRLQATGLAAAALIGLAVGLPQAFGRSAPSTPSRGANGSTGLAANEPAAGSASGRGSIPHTASCQVNGRPAALCGDIATGPAARRLSQAVGTHRSAATAYGSSSTTGPLGPVLVVKAGTTIVIDLPAINKKWLWSIPAIAGNTFPQGSEPPLVVTSTGHRGDGQQFRVTTQAATTVVLEAREDVFAARSGANAPTIVSGSAPVWALELQVEGS